MSFDVFVSYSHEDKAVADDACAALEAEGIRCWIAPRDVAPGAEWAAAIVDALDRCRVLVLIFSSKANGSKQVYREVQRAFEHATPVVPVRVENVEPAQSLAYYLGSVHWLDALTPPLEAHFKHLSAAVKALLHKRIASSDAAVGKQRVDQFRPRAESSQPAFAIRPNFRWLLGVGGAGLAAVAVAWFAWRVPTSTIPTSPARQVAAIEGASKGTMQCDKLPWTATSLHAAVTLSVKGGNATFERDVYSSDGKRKIGVESGTGAMDADGVLQLKTSWISSTSRFDGAYIGRLSAVGGTLSGKQILLVDGARHERPCTIIVGKFSA